MHISSSLETIPGTKMCFNVDSDVMFTPRRG
jgi:mRNA (2'-O-methyladenosine-N6-)-methyltransferase